MNEQDALDQNKLRLALEYYRTYYYDKLWPGYATEEILKCIAMYAVGRRWIDLGAGPHTYFWGLAMPETLTDIWITDICKETLFAARTVADGTGPPPPCHIEALEYIGKDPDSLHHLSAVASHYNIVDAMKPWRIDECEGGFDTITAFGVFGLSPGPEQFSKCFVYARANQRDGGSLVGANWFHPRLRNDYLSTGLVLNSLESAGYTPRIVKEHRLPANSEYEFMVYYVGVAE